jgi:hypothetical protein
LLLRYITEKELLNAIKTGTLKFKSFKHSIKKNIMELCTVRKSLSNISDSLSSGARNSSAVLHIDRAAIIDGSARGVKINKIAEFILADEKDVKNILTKYNIPEKEINNYIKNKKLPDGINEKDKDDLLDSYYYLKRDNKYREGEERIYIEGTGEKDVKIFSPRYMKVKLNSIDSIIKNGLVDKLVEYCPDIKKVDGKYKVVSSEDSFIVNRREFLDRINR